MNNKGIVKCICVSENRGTAKQPVNEASLRVDHGIVGDAHAGNWHRQISLLGYEVIEQFREKGAEVSFGDFGENLVVEGFDLKNIGVGRRFAVGTAVIEITQIGKICHNHCEIFKRMGECIMPGEGIFAKVIKSGEIAVGDSIELLEEDYDRRFTAAVITVSDKASRGERKDESGPVLCDVLTKKGYELVEYFILPDEQDAIERELIRLADSRQVNLVITTGGTGFSQRDITPEATMNVATRNAPGIAEAIRAESMKITGRAMLSRGASVIRNKTLIINLPGSSKAAGESIDIIIEHLEHGLAILLGRTGECGG